MEAALPRFQAAHTQVLGVSVDSVYSHANWGKDLGGVSFPLLSDFEPKGAVAKSFGLYLEGPGITDRATVVIDSGGTVRHASSVGPGGERNIDELVAICEKMDRESKTPTVDFAPSPGLGAESVLYVKSQCGFSRAVLLACDNLHAGHNVVVRNVSEDEDAAADLEKATGASQAPCLIVDGKPIRDSAEIINFLVGRAIPALG